MEIKVDQDSRRGKKRGTWSTEKENEKQRGKERVSACDRPRKEQWGEGEEKWMCECDESREVGVRGRRSVRVIHAWEGNERCQNRDGRE